MYERYVVSASTTNYDFIASRSLGKETCDLLDKLLTCNPRERITATEALDHDYFWTDPLPADPKKWGFARYSPLTVLDRKLTTSSAPRTDTLCVLTMFLFPCVNQVAGI